MTTMKNHTNGFSHSLITTSGATESLTQTEAKAALTVSATHEQEGTIQLVAAAK